MTRATRFLSRHFKYEPIYTPLAGTSNPRQKVLYLERWHLVPKNRFLNVYVHKFHRPDTVRDLHDHPWHNVSVILSGHYWEITSGADYLRGPGEVHFRKATKLHRIEALLPSAGLTFFAEPVWTLFITGPKIRDWGFQTVDGWVPHWEYNKNKE